MNKNKLYLLERIEHDDEYLKDDPWSGMQVDVVVGTVVSAPDAMSAREVAAKNCGDEGLRAWRDTQWTSLRCISEQTEETTGLVLKDTL